MGVEGVRNEEEKSNYALRIRNYGLLKGGFKFDFFLTTEDTGDHREKIAGKNEM